MFENEIRGRTMKSESDILRIELQCNSFETNITKSVENLSKELNSIIQKQNQNELNLVSVCERVNAIESETRSLRSGFQTLNCLSGDIVCLKNELNLVRSDAQTIEKQLSKELNVRLESHVIKLRELKESVTKLNPPRIVGGFKASDAIQIFVPGSSPLCEGIISYLTRRCGGNVCDRQCVYVFSDSLSSNSCQPKNAADLSMDTCFCSMNHPNQSIGYDFKDNQTISPTHYAIRSVVAWTRDNPHPKSWVIEVTNDRSICNSWIEINRRENNEDLNSSGILQTFRISHPPSSEFRFIRFRQISTNHRSDHYLGITAFELFGQLRIRTAIPL
jgi:hypothetical protein